MRPHTESYRSFIIEADRLINKYQFCFGNQKCKWFAHARSVGNLWIYHYLDE